VQAVHFLPMWMAPNLVTMIGLSLVISSYFITWFYMPNFEGVAPWWCYAWNGVALLAYQCLDAIDGKQARRTGSSSALGMLFDHGCDVLNLCLTSMTLVSTAQLGGSWKSALCISSGSFVFFMDTMEEYWSGELSLPFINGPNEVGTCIRSIKHAL
jgi:ethanolaminephosphotransferase